MKIYLDSSIAVGILLEQNEYKKYHSVISGSHHVFSSHLLEAELLSAAKREDVSLAMAVHLLQRFSLVFVESSLQAELMQIFELGYCKGPDACHLATALYLNPQANEFLFLTADKTQRSLARKLGFKVL